MFTDAFIGQENISEQVRVSLVAAKSRGVPFPHALFTGPPGLGKSMLARLIARDMGAKLIYRVASAVKNEKDLFALFTPMVHLKNQVVFIDEVEQLGRYNTELLHTALEEFILATPRKAMVLHPYTFLGATNYVGELPQPFRDRFNVQLEFSEYSEEDLYAILIARVHTEGMRTTKGALTAIAARARGVPRNAIRYLKYARDVAIAYEEFKGLITTRCAMKSFEVMGVDSLGLTSLDRAILQRLEYAQAPLGLHSLAQLTGEDEKTVEAAEGFMLRKGLLVRGPRGRLITTEGAKHLGLTVLAQKKGDGEDDNDS